MTLTLRLLGDGHAQPLQVDAVLATDAGGSAAKWMKGYCANDQRQLQTQFRCPRDIDTNLVERKRGNFSDIVLIISRVNKRQRNHD